MKCVRCEKEFDDYIPHINAECYGGVVYYACKHCGKLYSFQRTVMVSDAEYCAESREEDDWGNKVVSDKEYKELIKQ